MSPYRAALVSPSGDASGWERFDAEIVILLCSVVGLGIGIARRRFGAEETVAMIGFVLSLREILRGRSRTIVRSE